MELFCSIDRDFDSVDRFYIIGVNFSVAVVKQQFLAKFPAFLDFEDLLHG